MTGSSLLTQSFTTNYHETASIHNLQSSGQVMVAGVMIWVVMMRLSLSVVMVTENTVQLEWPQRPGLTERGKAHRSKHEAWRNNYQHTAASINGKPMRCKCINVAGLMEFYIRGVIGKSFQNLNF